MKLHDLLDELPDEALVSVAWVRAKLGEEPEPDDGLDRLFDVPELAARFDRSEATIRSWLTTGRCAGSSLRDGSGRSGARKFERSSRGKGGVDRTYWRRNRDC